jgi:ABC-type Fe3+/spermidine/putrescine transport system ATPase subunit
MAEDGTQAVSVELDRIGKRFGNAQAVRDLSLAVERGEFFTLLGPSGCGKSTTLRIVAGLLDPDEGAVRFDSRDVTRLPPWERHLGMVFQNYALWPHMTVFDNVAFGLVERRVPGPEVRRRVAEALEKVGLAGMEGRFPSQLSGGQQQRVALARALVVRPRLLLLDEPFSNLDAKLRVQMRAELARLQRELGITTLYVTHDQEEALVLSDRIALLESGRLVQAGSPRELYERPREPFVADFLGGANLLDGVVRRAGSGEAEIQVAGTTVTLPVDGPLAPGARVWVSVRPEHLRLSGDAGTGALSGVVRATDYLGWTLQAEVELHDGARVQVRGLDPAVGLQPGERVVLRLDPQRVRVFPQA